MEPLLTKRQAADLFRVSTRTIDRWRSRNLDLGAVKIHNTVRFSRVKLEKLIDARSRRQR